MRPLVALLLTASGLLAGCSSSSSLDCPAETVADASGRRCVPTSLAGVAQLCAEAEPVAFSETLVLPDLPAACPWDSDDNLSPAQNEVTARAGFRDISAFPSGAVPCSLDFDFEPEGMAQAIDYDDGFFLLFGDVVLASSHAALVERLPMEGPFRIFDWSAIAGEELGFFGVEPYCLGEAEGLGTCAIASAEEPGPISVDLDASLRDQLAFRAFEEDELAITLVAVGDNDAGEDCRASRFVLGIDVPHLPAE
ncbi:MAG: hypothetical protein AAF447_06815 [Myxococcota bacterium]